MDSRGKSADGVSAGKWINFEGKEPTKQLEMDFTYTNIDKLVQLSLGENPNFSNAFYNGNYSLSLEEAQHQKFQFICDNLHIQKDSKVLDLGCGWGGFLVHLKKIGAIGTGINLSSGQIAACRKSGLTVHFKDARTIVPEDFGIFDAVTAIGSFDHAASVDDYLSGRQDAVYDNYFRKVANVLKPKGRFFMQTMEFGKNMIPYESFDINAPKSSNEYICALQIKHFPDSWLPFGKEQIFKAAEPYFNILYHSSGRLDYIETNKQWRKRFFKFSLPKYLWFLSLVPKLFTDKEFRHQLDVLRIGPNLVCFEREIMDHSRIVFEKK
jgi:cyclopropane-fatty-acyl-phospholipid synthase